MGKLFPLPLCPENGRKGKGEALDFSLAILYTEENSARRQTMSSLGENLVHARKKAGLTQEEVGEKLGVSRQTISKWELDLSHS